MSLVCQSGVVCEVCFGLIQLFHDMKELAGFEHQRDLVSDTSSVTARSYMSSIGTIGQPPTAPVSGSGQYWATHPLTNQYSLNNIHTLPSEAQAQCLSLVQAFMGYFNNPLDSPLMLFPSRYIYYQSNPIIAGMLPHMVHITAWFTLIGPAQNYLRAGDPLQRQCLHI